MRSVKVQRDGTRAQRDWLDTYRQLAEPRHRHTTALRRRLLDLSAYLQWHPFWSTPSGTPAARVELRRLAHRQEQRETRAAPDVLSSRQEAILATIRDWIAETGESPSVRQIGARVGLSSTSSVVYQLGRLEARGLISRTGHRWRSCRLTT